MNESAQPKLISMSKVVGEKRSFNKFSVVFRGDLGVEVTQVARSRYN